MATERETQGAAAILTEREIAQALLAIGAVTLRPDKPFTWSSGLRAPIYCDNRLLLAYPDLRAKVAAALAASIGAQAGDVDVIAGTATAGIPHAAWVAARLKLPMVYVRAKAKDHGKQSRIEGHLLPGQRVAVIEDLVSTGGSSLAAAAALREEGAHVVGVFAIFTYELPAAKQNFAAANVPLVALCRYAVLLDVARTDGRISEDQLAVLRAWREAPERWGR